MWILLSCEGTPGKLSEKNFAIEFIPPISDPKIQIKKFSGNFEKSDDLMIFGQDLKFYENQFFSNVRSEMGRVKPQGKLLVASTKSSLTSRGDSY